MKNGNYFLSKLSIVLVIVFFYFPLLSQSSDGDGVAHLNGAGHQKFNDEGCYNPDQRIYFFVKPENTAAASGNIVDSSSGFHGVEFFLVSDIGSVQIMEFDSWGNDRYSFFIQPSMIPDCSELINGNELHVEIWHDDHLDRVIKLIICCGEPDPFSTSDLEYRSFHQSQYGSVYKIFTVDGKEVFKGNASVTNQLPTGVYYQVKLVRDVLLESKIIFVE